MQNKNRIYWIDLAKTFGIVLVFYGHIIEQFSLLGSNAASMQFKFIYSFHMPLFFMLSGFFAVNPDRFRFKKYFLTRMVPFLFFNVLSLLILISVDALHGRLNPADYCSGIISLIAGYPQFNLITWFLVCLFTTEILYFFFKRFVLTRWIGHCVAITLYCIGWLAAGNSTRIFHYAGIHFNFWYFGEALVAFGFYYFGSTIRGLGFDSTKMPARKQLMFSLAVLAILILTFNMNRSSVDMAFSVHGNPILFPLSAFAGSFFIIFLSKAVHMGNKILFVGENTLILIGINGIFYNNFNAKFAGYFIHLFQDSHFAIVVICGLGTVFSLLISLPFIWLFNRYVPQLAGKPSIDGPILKRFID